MTNWSLKKNQLLAENGEKIVWEGEIKVQEITPSSIICSSNNYELHIEAKTIELAVLQPNYSVILCDNLKSFKFEKRGK